MRNRLLTPFLLTFTWLIASAQDPTGNTASFAATSPGQLTWVPKEVLPKGAFSATAHGDPHSGAYAFYARFPGDYTVPLHWHTHDVEVAILEGSMTITYPGHEPVTIKPEGYFFLPARQGYVVHCDKPCLFLAWGSHPFDFHYSDQTGQDR